MLNRQAVRIPTGLPRHVVALHGLEAREHVLKRAREHVVDAGLVVGRGRSLVKAVARLAFGLREALGERVVVTPELEHVLLKPGSVIAAFDRVECHRLVLARAQKNPGRLFKASGAEFRGTTRFRDTLARTASVGTRPGPCREPAVAIYCPMPGVRGAARGGYSGPAQARDSHRLPLAYACVIGPTGPVIAFAAILARKHNQSETVGHPKHKAGHRSAPPQL